MPNVAVHAEAACQQENAQTYPLCQSLPGQRRLDLVSFGPEDFETKGKSVRFFAGRRPQHGQPHWACPRSHAIPRKYAM
jgi:hypothetical protein